MSGATSTQIVRDLVEVGIGLVRDEKRRQVEAKAHLAAEERVLDALVGKTASAGDPRFVPPQAPGERARRQRRSRSRRPPARQAAGCRCSRSPGCRAPLMGAINLSDMLGKALGGSRPKARRLTVKEAYAPLIQEESDKLLDQDAITSRRRSARSRTTASCSWTRSTRSAPVPRAAASAADVSREGVQRDLLPLIEGTSVSTKHGTVKTDHILFIASGAFHVSKPSDLLPELQGRLPIRVELNPLTIDDFRRILTETEASLIKQAVALMETEGVRLDFTEDSIEALAKVAVDVNGSVENIGARRLQTVLERVLDDISFTAPDRSGETFTVDGTYVRSQVESLAANTDLSRFIL